VNVSLPHAVSVWRRNATMYQRTWLFTLLPRFFAPVLYLLAIGLGVGAYVDQMGGMSYAQFLAPGLVCVAAMNGASFEVTYNVFVRLHFDRAYDAMLTTPVAPNDIVAGEILWAVTRSCVYGGSFLIVVTLFGLAPLPWALGALVAIPLSGLLFAAIGIAFTMRVPTIDAYSFYFTLFLTPLFLFSDVFFPLRERLPGFWLWVAEVLPLLHPVRIARHAFRGELSWLVLWDVVYVIGLSTALLAWTLPAARRRLTS